MECAARVSIILLPYQSDQSHVASLLPYTSARRRSLTETDMSETEEDIFDEVAGPFATDNAPRAEPKVCSCRCGGDDASEFLVL